MDAIKPTPAEVFAPGEFLQDELAARNWSQADLADILGKPAKAVNEIILGKRRISPEMARLLSQALGTGPNVWLNLESAYQLYKVERTSPITRDVSQRAALYNRYPVRDMIKRGWIEHTENVDVLEVQMKDFYTPEFPYAARKRDEDAKSPLQLAWLHRTYNLARRMNVEGYSETKVLQALASMKPLLSSVEEIPRVPEILKNAGIRFLVVEALPGSKIDGVCFWLDENSPVIAVSLRFDRIDHFWFTLLHELFHVKNRHGMESAILDTNLMERDAISDDERQADEEASAFLVPLREMDDFIARVRPLFSTSQIMGFSRRIGVHMGIVVGQLQHRRCIDFGRNRNMLVKVRATLTQTATNDGWGMIA